MSGLDVLRRHVEEFERETGISVAIEVVDMQALVILKEVPLPRGSYAIETTDVLFVTDLQYPMSAMDMFWTDVGVTLPGGGLPAGSESIESYGGRQWRRFSWHRNGVWNPARNGLLDHFEFMQARFAIDAA
jgi:hypothetical protein